MLAATPPRRKLDPGAEAAQHGKENPASERATIEQASFSEGNETKPVLDDDLSGVAATVNGIPILVSDVLERFTPRLKEAEAKVSAADFAELKRKLIERELPAHIEQAILVDSALSKLKPEQREMVDEQLDKIFVEELGRIQAEMGAKSVAELEAILQEAGTSITTLQRSFNNRQLAGQAMGLLTPAEPTVSRSEMLKEYQQRLDEFTEPERVRWQQIWISYKKHGGQKQALDVLDNVVRALRSNAPFDTVAQEFSDGIKADDGGQWDWTQRGELSDEEIEKLLFELPVGEVGPVVSGENAFQIVRVTERQSERTKTFGEVQDQIAKEIKQRKQQEMLEETLAELKDKAVVTTMFDSETEQKH